MTKKMSYFHIDTAGDLNNPNLCLITNPPEELGIQRYRLSCGKSAKKYFSPNAKVYMNEAYPGIKLSGILGNLNNHLIVSSKVKDIIVEMCNKSTIEYYSFSLFNHKKRLHSTDYYYVNPIGGFDCLNEEASEIEYSDSGSVISIKNYILDCEKIRNAPHLFRIDKDLSEYLFSFDLLQKLKKIGATNIVCKKLVIK